MATSRRRCGKGGLKSLPGTRDTMHQSLTRTIPGPLSVLSSTGRRRQARRKAWLRFTRHLIQLRHRYIVPLLAAGGAAEGMILHAAAQALAVSWQFSGGTLSVALNIGEERAAMPEIPGEVIFSWPERQEALSPNSIVVRFAHGEASS